MADKLKAARTELTRAVRARIVQQIALRIAKDELAQAFKAKDPRRIAVAITRCLINDPKRLNLLAISYRILPSLVPMVKAHRFKDFTYKEIVDRIFVAIEREEQKSKERFPKAIRIQIAGMMLKAVKSLQEKTRGKAK